MKFLILSHNTLFTEKICPFLTERGQDVVVFSNIKINFSKNFNVIIDDFKNLSNHLDILKDVDYTILPPYVEKDFNYDEEKIQNELTILHQNLRTINSQSPNNGILFYNNCAVYRNFIGIANESAVLYPNDNFGKFLLSCEQIITNNFSKYMIYRVADILDFIQYDSEHIVSQIISDVKNKKQVVIGNSINFVSLIDLEYTLNITYYMLNNKLNENKIINIGNANQTVTHLELLQIIENTINRKIDYVYANTDDILKPKIDYTEIESVLKYINVKFFQTFNLKPIHKYVYDIFLKDKVLFALEGFDSILNTYRPNGASKTWYLEEEGALDYPKMWGRWNIIEENENNGIKIFPKETFNSQVLPGFNDEYIETLNVNSTTNKNYIYLINVFDANFFYRNRNIGFNCITKKYLNDAKNGICKIVLTLPMEGYSGSHGNHDLEILDEWIKKSELPTKSVYFISGNLIISEIAKEKNLDFTCLPISYFDTWIDYQKIKEFPTSVKFEPDDKEYLFLSYNRAPRNHRVYFLSRIYEKNLLSLGKVSLNTFNLDENLSDTNPTRLLHKLTPLLIDRTLQYNLANVLEISDHVKTFMSIVTETLTYRNTLFLSEKIWKPLACGHPFMVLGSRHTLKKLKEYGFKTFDKWFDESYDEVDIMEIRADMIANEVEKYKEKTIDELKAIRLEMKEICDYNRKYFIKFIENKYSFNGERLDNYKELLSIINQINLNIL